MSRILPSIALVSMAFIVAELLPGSAPITQPILWPFLLLIYGPGALLIRESVRRRKRGWESVVLLGAMDLSRKGSRSRACTIPHCTVRPIGGPALLSLFASRIRDRTGRTIGDGVGAKTSQLPAGQVQKGLLQRAIERR